MSARWISPACSRSPAISCRSAALRALPSARPKERPLTMSLYQQKTTIMCSENPTVESASQVDMNDMANSKMPASDGKPAGVVKISPLNQTLPLESADQTQPKMPSSRNPASDDKSVDQTTTITSKSLGHAPPSDFADQSQARLMTVPRELRDMIYGHVFYYNTDDRKASIKPKGEDADPKNKSPYPLPSRILLERTAPPSKEVILPCRELYLEMRQLYIAAYRAYWTNNQFAFPIGLATYDRWLDIVGSHPSKRARQELAQLDRFGTPPPVTSILRMLPSTQDMRRIRHFTASWHGSDIFDVVFEQGKWHARALSPHDKPPGPCDAGYYGWRRAQGQVEKEIQALLLASARHMRKDALLDPRTGEGLHGGVLTSMARYEDRYDFLLRVWMGSAWWESRN
jgi:hypothetical protein